MGVIIKFPKKSRLTSNNNPSPSLKKIPTLMQQYFDVKVKNKDVILFYRMGDFCELFFEDAEVASEILGLTLIQRRGTTIPLCGVPYHSIKRHMAILVKAGHKVALCDIVDEDTDGAPIMEVIKITSPGLSLVG